MKLFQKYKIEIIVFLFFVLIHLPQIGHDNFNTDVWKWKARSYDFGTGIFNFVPEKTLQKYHPGVPLMWVGSAAIKIDNLILDYYPRSVTDQIFLLDILQKLLLAVFLGIGLTLIIYPLRQLFGANFAIITALLITLEPFYLGLTRVFHLEGIVSTFMLASVVWLFYYIRDIQKSRRLITASVFAAIAVLTKTSAALIGLFTFIVLINYLKNNGAKFVTHKILIWLGVFVVSCLTLWPALWAIPLETINALYKGIFIVGIDTDHLQYYFGKLIESPGYLYYFVVFAFRSSLYLFLGLVGFIFAYKYLPENKKEFAKFILLYTALYLLEITIPSKKLDRYLLPAMVSILVLTAFFWETLLSKISAKLNKINKNFLLGIFFIPSLLTNIYIFPDYFTFYNPLTGGFKTGIYALEPKWMIGTQEIIDYFAQKRKTEGLIYAGESESFEEILAAKTEKKILSVGFQEKYYTQIWPFFREIGAWAVIQDLTPFAEKTRYFVYPVWADSGKDENRFELKLIDTIKIRNVPVYNVYERNDW